MALGPQRLGGCRDYHADHGNSKAEGWTKEKEHLPSAYYVLGTWPAEFVYITSWMYSHVGAQGPEPKAICMSSCLPGLCPC